MHIGLVNLASEALVGGEAHSEVADLNVEQLQDGYDERERDEEQNDHRGVENIGRVEVEDTQVICTELVKLIVDLNLELAIGVSGYILVVGPFKMATFDEYKYYLKKHQKELEDLGEEINKEDVVVAYSHAVIDPWTMMIVSFHAPLAYDAVSAPPSPNYPALRAQTLRIKCLEQTQKLHAFGIYVPWIS